MTDLRVFINDITEGTDKSYMDIITFLEDNSWFGSKPDFSETVELTDEQIKKLAPRCRRFIQGEDLEKSFKTAWSKTYKHYKKFCKKILDSPNDEDSFFIYDFLLYHLEDELNEYSNLAIKDLIGKADAELLKRHAEYLAFFVSWMKTYCKTVYTKDYVLLSRYKMTIQNEAYSMDTFLELLYKLFNESYIEEHDMYRRAAASQKYVDAWLFMSMHFICSIRLTDLERLPHPILQDPPEQVLREIAEDTYDHGKIMFTLQSVLRRFEFLELTPKKTSRNSGIETLKMNIPTSCQLHFGKLFCIAEAHRQLSGDNSPIIRKVSTYVEIRRAMGEEIASLFLHRDFGARSATKSFLQSRFDLTKDVLGIDNANLAAMLVSHARSHKGAYGTYAQTSLVYLKDAKFNGYSYDQIAYELMERGVLSFIPAMLLDMATQRAYSNVDVKAQTELVKVLDISPEETELIVKTVEQSKEQAKQVAHEILTQDIDIVSALKNICAGTAVSKQPECMCILTAIGKFCPYTDRKLCIGCKYEISTTSTLMFLVSEYKRLLGLYKNATDPLEKAKYKDAAETKVIPVLLSSIECLKSYSDEIVTDYTSLVKELMYD